MINLTTYRPCRQNDTTYLILAEYRTVTAQQERKNTLHKLVKGGDTEEVKKKVTLDDRERRRAALPSLEGAKRRCYERKKVFYA